jgi:hypothetical protein
MSDYQTYSKLEQFTYIGMCKALFLNSKEVERNHARIQLHANNCGIYAHFIP